MLITVAICTRDRAESLDRTLRSLHEATVPDGLDWELVVVDNGSTDETAAVLGAWKADLPVSRILEPEPGLSRARNRAVDAARGTHILWTDDDVCVDAAWLAEYARAFKAFPDDAFFGGPIRAHFEASPPAWLPRVLDRVPGAFAIRDLGSQALRLGPGNDRLPFGANYAVRTPTQRRHRYDHALGMKPGPFVRGEEMAVFQSMLRNGESGRWVPEARVTHFIPTQRQNERYVRAFYRLDAATRPGFGGRTGRLGLLMNALRAEARFRVLRFTAPPERWITALVEACEAWGVRDRVTNDTRRIARD